MGATGALHSFVRAHARGYSEAGREWRGSFEGAGCGGVARAVRRVAEWPAAVAMSGRGGEQREGTDKAAARRTGKEQQGGERRREAVSRSGRSAGELGRSGRERAAAIKGESGRPWSARARAVALDAAGACG